jgi:hypothetical protein
MSNREAWSPDGGMLLVYTDDIIITGNTRTEISNKSEEINKGK